MEHLIPTLLGIAGALAPVALGYWKNDASTPQRFRRATRLAPVTANYLFDDAIVRGGRVYL